MVLVPKALQLTDFDFTIVQCFVNKRHTHVAMLGLKIRVLQFLLIPG